MSIECSRLDMPPKLEVYVFDSATGELFKDTRLYDQFMGKIDALMKEKEQKEQQEKEMQQHVTAAISHIETHRQLQPNRPRIRSSRKRNCLQSLKPQKIGSWAKLLLLQSSDVSVISLGVTYQSFLTLKTRTS